MKITQGTEIVFPFLTWISHFVKQFDSVDYASQQLGLLLPRQGYSSNWVFYISPLLGHTMLCLTFKFSYTSWVGDREREERKGKKFSSQPKLRATNIPLTIISSFSYIDIVIIKHCTYLWQTSVSCNEQPCDLEWCTGWRASRKVREKKLQEGKILVRSTGQEMSQAIMALKTF